MNVTLYSTHCPKCNILETKLKQKSIDFSTIEDPKEVVKIGRENKIMSAPILVVDRQVMDFSKAVAWVNSETAEVGDSCSSCKL